MSIERRCTDTAATRTPVASVIHELRMSKMTMMAFPELTHQVIDIFAAQDRVIVRFVFRGTHKAALEGIPATGNTIGVGTICIFPLKNGLVVEEIQDGDMLGLFQQPGTELKPRAPAK